MSGTKTITLDFTVSLSVTLEDKARIKYPIHDMERAIGGALAEHIEGADGLHGWLDGVTVNLSTVSEQSDSKEN